VQSEYDPGRVSTRHARGTSEAGAKLAINSTQSIANTSTQSIANTSTQSIVVIDSRTLFRECLVRCMEVAYGPRVLAFPSVQSWEEVIDQTSVCVIVLSMGGKARNAESLQRDIALLSRIAGPIPIVMLADTEEPSQILEALDQGARGYIPTSASLSIAVEAMRLVGAGGMYVPADCLLFAHRTTAASPQKHPRIGVVTERQTAVLDALRRGKANKIIAYELNMRESTVKVHVRNIMKKLKASNRTEAAYMANALINRDGGLDSSLRATG
jgi:DNA-binding NarL/FixJ family response regulator